VGARAHSRAGVALVLAALALGCPGKPAEPKAAPAPAPSTAARAVVPRPPGWTVWVAEDDSLQSGPGGRAVLRVDKRPGQGAALPSAEELARQAVEELEGLGASVESAESKSDTALVLLKLADKPVDAGTPGSALVLFGARRMGEDLFLCATLPGSSEEEVRAALGTCRDIQVQKQGK
jgi:hypothetical protein